MREALARSDQDFVVAEPRRRKTAPPRRGAITALFATWRFLRLLAAYPNRLLGGLVFALTIAIMVNALMLQHSRHPAPLFRKTFAAPELALPAAPVSSAARQKAADEVLQSAAPPEPAVPHRDPITQLLKAESPAASAGADKRLVTHRHGHDAAGEGKPAQHDAITQLLDSGPAARTSGERAKEERPKEERVKEERVKDERRSKEEYLKEEHPKEERPQTVAAVQQALIKLGFVVRPDGQMGTVTRRALEQYERDHKLPVDGRLTVRLLHRLSAETGIAIE